MPTRYMCYPFFCDNDIKDVAEWLNCETDDMVFEFIGENIRKFEKQITEMENSLSLELEDAKKVKMILDLLRNDKVPYAIFVSKDDNFILEGRHRIVAFRQYGLRIIPVYYVTVNKTEKKKENNITEKFVVMNQGREILRVDTEDEASKFCYSQNKGLIPEIMCLSPLYCSYKRLLIDEHGNETFAEIKRKKVIKNDRI